MIGKSNMKIPVSMHATKIVFIILLFLTVFAASTQAASVSIIPKPKSITIKTGTPLSGVTLRCDVAEFTDHAYTFIQVLRSIGAREAAMHSEKGKAAVIIFNKNVALPVEAYSIKSQDKSLIVSASSISGIARATATLIQAVDITDGKAVWPRLNIIDQPDNPYRSFMIDM